LSNFNFFANARKVEFMMTAPCGTAAGLLDSALAMQTVVHGEENDPRQSGRVVQEVRGDRRELSIAELLANKVRSCRIHCEQSSAICE
jgi:hypothetical protein